MPDARRNSTLHETFETDCFNRVKYLEGLRGITVLLIILDHIFRSTLVFWPYTGWKATLRDLLNWISNGRASLACLATLSGYLLMKQILEHNGQHRGGPTAYFRRRALRLLPPYYAAFIGSMLLIHFFPPMQTRLSVEWQDALPISGPGSTKMILTHILLVHNFSYKWAFKSNPPIWTPATLAQIYILFPLLLLPLWRKIGMTATVTLAFALSLGGFLLTGKGHAAAPWFFALFALGMAAAQRERTHYGYERLFYGSAAAILLIAYAAVTLAFSLGCYRFLTVQGWEGISCHWFFDTWIAVATACFLIFASSIPAISPSPGTPGEGKGEGLTGHQSKDPPPHPPAPIDAESGRRNLTPEHWLTHQLSRPWIANIGTITYGTYLIHDPLLALMKIPLDRLALAMYAQFACYLVIGAPIVLIISWAFHQTFEKPFRAPVHWRSTQ